MNASRNNGSSIVVIQSLFSNAEDIIAGVIGATKEELERGAQRNTEIIVRVLESFAKELEGAGVSVWQNADFVQRTSAAAKYSATSRKHLTDLLAALRRLAFDDQPRNDCKGL